MNKSSRQIIIVKKPKKYHHKVHGGSWKIAYADFMTAMMALFLIMWLMVSITPEQRHQLAVYFNNSADIIPSPGSKDSYSDSVIPIEGGDIIKQDGNILSYRMNADVLSDVKNNIENLIDTDPRLNNFKSNLLLTINDSGLLIQIIDSQERPMFMIGSKKPESYMTGILQALVPLLNEIPNRLTLTGHTDSLPFANGEYGYSNWELSVDRANAVRQVLVSNGLNKDKVLQIIGVASNMAVDDEDPKQAINRRITILVLTKNKERQAFQDGGLIKEWLKNPAMEVLEKNLTVTEYQGVEE
jgi:chemotaxis protein MotB